MVVTPLKNRGAIGNPVAIAAVVAIAIAVILALQSQHAQELSGLAVLGGQDGWATEAPEVVWKNATGIALPGGENAFGSAAGLAPAAAWAEGSSPSAPAKKKNQGQGGGGTGTSVAGQAGKDNAANAGAAGPSAEPATRAESPATAANESGLQLVSGASATAQRSLPSMNSFPPKGEVELQKGALQEFSAKAVDGDGNALLVDWLVDGKNSGTGSSIMFDSGRHPEGMHTVKAVAAVGGVSVSKEWEILIVQPPQPADPASKIHPLLLSGPGGMVTRQSVGQDVDVVRVLISVDDASRIADVGGIIEKNGGRVEEAFGVGGIVVASIDRSKLIEVARDGNVISLWPNLKVSAALDESVPQIAAQEVWAQGYRGGNVRVAVIDTGIDMGHPMLSGRVAKERNFTLSGTASDVYGHGTHVAGIIAGSRAQGGMLDGVAPGALLYNVKALDDNGDGYFTDIIAGINWAMDPDSNPDTDDGAQIINMSFGEAAKYSNANPLAIAVKGAVEKGVIVVASAGNCGPVEPSETCRGYAGVTTPGNSPDAIAVGAINDLNEWAGFSSGESIEGVGIKPDIAAPGVLIKSSYPDGRYRHLSGTSMAAPHVSGAAALLLGANPALNPQQIKKLLELTATDLGEPGKDIKFGSGLLGLSGIIEPRPALSSENVSGSIEESEAYTSSITITNEGAKNLEIYGMQPAHGIEASLGKTSLGAAESAELDFSIRGTDVGVGPFEGTIDLNTNAGVKSVHVKLQVGTSTKPVVRSLSIPKIVWRGEVSDIVVLATDDSTVTSVIVRITSPLGASAEIPLVLSADGKWRYLDYAFPKETKDKGSYKLKVIATDDSANTTAYESAFDLVNVQFVLPGEYVVNSPAAIKASYKNTSFRSNDTAFVAGIYNETGEKADELLQTKEVQSGELHGFNLEWTPPRTGNYSMKLKLLENGALVEELEKRITVLVPDAVALRGFSVGLGRIEKGASQSFDVNAENFSASDLNALIEVDIMRGGIVADVLVLENAALPPNSVQSFALRKDILLPAGTYSAVARLHFGNRTKDSNMLMFEVATPPAGTIDSVELPERVYTDTAGKIKAVFRNSGRVPLDVSLYGKIMDGNIVVGSLDFNSAQVRQDGSYTFEADADFNGLSGSYSLKITAEYEGNISETEKNFFVADNKAPVITRVSHDVEVKKGSPFMLRLEVQDSSRIAEATLSVNGEKTAMKEVSSINNTYFLAGTYYGTGATQEYSFSAQVCDEYSNCSTGEAKTFRVVDCAGTKALIVSEDDAFAGLLGQGYCAAQWKESLSDLPPIGLLRSFEVVIWGEGPGASGIDGNEAALLQDYVASGGRLFLEGPGIASVHRDDAFMSSVAHAALAQGTVFTVEDSSGLPSGPSGSGRIIVRVSHPAVKGQSYFDINKEIFPYSDSLFPINGGRSIADWNTGNSAMVVFDDYNTTGARGIFLPLAFSSIETSKQKSLIENAIAWLVSSPELDFNVKKILTQDYIVAGENIPVTIELENAGSAEVLVYVDGGLVAGKPVEAQSTGFNISFTPGNHNIRAEIKPAGDVAEMDYFNNTLEKNVFAAPAQADIAPLKLGYTPRQPNIGEPVEIYADIENNGGQTTDANVSFFIDGNLAGSQAINIPFGRQKTAGIQWVSSAGIHSITVISETSGDDANTQNNSLEGTIYVCNGPSVLIVADDDARSFTGASPDSTLAFEGALKAKGYCVSTWKESEKGTPTPGLLNNFSAIVWSAGNYWNRVMDENDSNLLAQFNGNILFEGADIGFDSNSPEFLERNLHASFDRDIILGKNHPGLLLSDSNLLEGITSIELDENLSPAPDSLIPFEGRSIADWNGSGSAIIVSEQGSQKRGFIGFSINAITPAETRDRLVSNFMQWLTFKNHALAILSVASNSPVKEGEKLVIDFNATDSEGDALSYSINSQKFSANGASFSWPTDFNSAGNYAFTISVSDGSLLATQNINIEVINVNRSPEILSVTTNSPVMEGGQFIIDINATDPDGEALTYSLANSQLFDGNAGQFAWNTDYNSAGDYNFTIMVSDGDLNTSSGINITILNTNRPPIIHSVNSNSPIKEGETLTIDINTTDPDNDPLVFSSDLGMLVFDGKGTFKWEPTKADVGVYIATITVTDGAATASQSVTFRVINQEEAPARMYPVTIRFVDSENNLIPVYPGLNEIEYTTTRCLQEICRPIGTQTIISNPYATTAKEGTYILQFATKDYQDARLDLTVNAEASEFTVTLAKKETGKLTINIYDENLEMIDVNKVQIDGKLVFCPQNGSACSYEYGRVNHNPIVGTISDSSQFGGYDLVLSRTGYADTVLLGTTVEKIKDSNYSAQIKESMKGIDWRYKTKPAINAAEPLLSIVFAPVIITDYATQLPGANPIAVSIIKPADNSVYTAPVTINLEAMANSANSIEKVEFYLVKFLNITDKNPDENFKLATLTEPPYVTGMSATRGIFTITAKAYTNQEETATSNPITITIKPANPP